MSDIQHVSSFVTLEAGEAFERDYHVAHSSLKRYPPAVIATILAGFLMYVVPGIVLWIYFAKRRMKVTHGLATITNKRFIYYEYNDHPAENFHSVSTMHLDDITRITCRVARGLLHRSFYLVLYTQKKGIIVGAEGVMGILRVFQGQLQLEPGPDALEFLQFLMGRIAAQRHEPAALSSQPSL